MNVQALTASLGEAHKVNRLLVAPSYRRGEFDSHAVDCPFVFRHAGRFHMTYVGWDGIGYRTGLATSSDLLNWHKEGMVIDRGPAGSVTQYNAALTWIVRDNDLMGHGQVVQVDGRFLGTYHAYPDAGYEAGSGAIGLCWSDDLRHWDMEAPCLRCDDADAGAWEHGGLYKSCLVQHDGMFYMFYNAKNVVRGSWREQTGVAVSDDLIQWRRHAQNPLLTVGAAGTYDDYFASDPCVLRYGDIWVLFYFGNCSDGHARDSAAFSEDLNHWEKSGRVILDVGEPGTIDSRHAHKPSMIFHAGALHHFYCAVAPAVDRQQGDIEHDERRGISAAVRGLALATTQP